MNDVLYLAMLMADQIGDAAAVDALAALVDDHDALTAAAQAAGVGKGDAKGGEGNKPSRFFR